MRALRLLKKAFFKKTAYPEYLTFFITNRCNARCPHCFYHDNINKPVNELTIDEIEKLAISMPHISYLNITGGEPFIRSDIAKIVSLFYRYAEPEIVIIPTNGSLVENIINACSEILSANRGINLEIAISLDAYGKAHDDIKNFPGLFEKARESFYALKELKKKYVNLKTSIGMVFEKNNQDLLEDSLLKFIEWKPDIIYLNMVRGNIKDPCLQGVDINKYEKLSEKIERSFKPRNFMSFVIASLGIYKRKIILKTLLENRYQLPCYAGILNMVIYPDGTVNYCELLENSLGNLRDFDMNFKKLYSQTQRMEFVKLINENRCFCTHECNLSSNILFTPRTWFSLEIEFLKLLWNKMQKKK
ncbi:MAG: radical SAM protein [Candidatus Coatesbacteria bacterium]|nr:radical SAM protein [Candidatus Coatesbacteria bacterium]